MTNGIEARSPFLDYRVIEFANKISPDLKFNLFSNKIILKEIYKQYLNKNIIYQKKQGLSGYHNFTKVRDNPLYSNSNLKYESDIVDFRLPETAFYNLRKFTI